MKVFGRTTDQTGITTHGDSMTKADVENLTTDTDLNHREYQDVVRRCSATKFLNDDIEEEQVQVRRAPDPASPEIATVSAKNFSVKSPGSFTKMIDRRLIDTSPSFGSMAANARGERSNQIEGMNVLEHVVSNKAMLDKLCNMIAKVSPTANRHSRQQAEFRHSSLPAAPKSKGEKLQGRQSPQEPQSPQKRVLCRIPTNRPKTLLTSPSFAMGAGSDSDDGEVGKGGVGRVSALAKEKSKLAGFKLSLPGFREQNDSALFESLLGFIRSKGAAQQEAVEDQPVIIVEKASPQLSKVASSEVD